VHSQDELSLKYFISLLIHYKKNLLVCAVFAIILTIFWHYKYPNYSAKGALQVQDKSNNTLQAITAQLSGITIFPDGTTIDPAEKVIQYIISYEFLREVALNIYDNKDPKIVEIKNSILNEYKSNIFSYLNLFNNEEKDANKEVEILTTYLSDNLKTEKSINDTIYIKFQNHNVNYAIELSNIILTLSKDILVKKRLSTLNLAQSFLEDQVTKAKTKISDLDFIISKSRMKNINSNDKNQNNNLVKQIQDLMNQVYQKRVALFENTEYIKKIKKTISPQSNGKFSNKAQLEYLTSKKNELETEIKSIEEVIKEIKKEHYSKNEISDETGVIKSIEVEYDLFYQFKKQLLQLEIQKISTQNDIIILDTARRSNITRSWALKKKLTINLLGTFSIALLFILMIDSVSPLVRRKSELSKYNLEIINSIPLKSEMTNYTYLIKKIFKLNQNEQSLYNFEIDDEITNSFKQIKSSLFNIFKDSSVHGKIILTSSSQQNEGKSFISSNLAYALAISGKKTLLIDADYKRKTTSSNFKFANTEGFVDYFKTGKINLQPTESENLKIMPAGFTNKSESFELEKLTKLTNSLKANFDYIIIDSPPILLTSVTLEIAPVVDMMLFVIGMDSVKRDFLDEAITRLKKTHPTDKIQLLVNKSKEMKLKTYYYHKSSINNDSKAA